MPAPEGNRLNQAFYLRKCSFIRVINREKDIGCVEGLNWLSAYDI